MELKTDLYAIKVLQPFVIVIICDSYKQIYECKEKITEKFVKDCISKTMTKYILGGK